MTRRPRIGGRRARRLGAGLALVVAVAVVVVLILAEGSSPSGSQASGASAGSVAVERRNLVQTDIESGTLGYSDPQTVYDRLSGTVTWLPQVGQRIGRGQALFRVDGEPVTLFYGGTPAYRSLGPADSDGADILELNRNLIALGFNPGGIVADDVWQAGTTLGVEQLQGYLNEAETGTLALGGVVFLPGAQLVSAVDGTVGATSGGGSAGSAAAGAGAAGAGASTGASTAMAAPRSEFVGLEGGPGTARRAGQKRPAGPGSSGRRRPAGPGPSSQKRPVAPAQSGRASSQELSALTALLKAESAQLRAEAAQLRAAKGAKKSAGSGAHADSSTASRGDSGAGGASASAILETTSERLVVTVDLAATSQSEAQVGEQVSVQLPAGSTVGGRVIAVSRIAQTPSSSGSGGGGGGGGGGNSSGPGSGSGASSSTVPVTIALDHRPGGAGLDQAAVSVSFAQARANHVLSVPVTALLAVPGGSYVLQEAGPPHLRIPVSTGLFAAGYVQVAGAGVYPGLQVTDSQG